MRRPETEAPETEPEIGPETETETVRRPKAQTGTVCASPELPPMPALMPSPELPQPSPVSPRPSYRRCPR